MARNKLIPYWIELREYNEPGKVWDQTRIQAHDPEFPFDNLATYFEHFLNEYIGEEDVHKDEKEEKTFTVQPPIKRHGNTIEGRFKSGEWGQNADFWDVEKHERITDARKENHAEEVPYYFLFHIPDEDSSQGLLILSRYKRKGVKTMFSKLFQPRNRGIEAGNAYMEIEPHYSDKVPSQDIDYASDTAKEANLGTVREMLDEIDYPVEIHSRQRHFDLSEYNGATGSTVTTDHYVLVKQSGSSVKQNHHQVKTRCINIQDLLTAGDLHAERLTGTQLESAVKQLYPGKTSISGSQYRTEYGQKQVCRMLYVDEYPKRLPLGWVAEVLNTETSGLVDIVQVTKPISDHDRDRMDRMLARIDSEISSSRKPSRQADLRRQKQDLEDLIDVEAGRETLVKYGVYIVVRGVTPGEARRTLESVGSVLNRFRVDTVEPRNLNQAFKRVSPFHTSRFNKTDIVPAYSAATGFSFATRDTIKPGGILFGKHRNGAPVIMNRFSWDAGHTAVMGKTGSGKTFWTKLLLLRSFRSIDDLEIYIVDPKKRDYGDFVEALDGETLLVDNGLQETGSDVVRYTVRDPSKDNTEKLAEAVRHVYRQAAKTDRKSLVVVDETHRIISKGDSIYQKGIQAVSTLVRESRHRNVAATLVTQNADDFTRSNEGKNILRNVDCNLFFKHKDVDSQVSDFFNLSDSQKTELRKLRTGNKLGFSEALIHGPVNTRIKVEATEIEHQLIENGKIRDETDSSNQSAVTEESQSEETENEKTQKSDGGRISKTEGNTPSKSKKRYGLLDVLGFVSGAPIGLFEYLLLTGFPAAVVLYQEEALKSVLHLNELPLNGTQVDVLAVWTAIFIAVELIWIIVMSIDTWQAQYWS